MGKMHVLLTPSWYPTVDHPLSGIFFHEQAQGLVEAGLEVGVVYAEFRSLTALKIPAVAQNHFQTTISQTEGLTTVRFKGWNLPRLTRARERLWVAAVVRLVDKYVDARGCPDVIHAHSALWGGVAAKVAARKLGVPYVLTEHSTAFARGLIKSWQMPFVRDAVSHAGAVVTVGSRLGQDVARMTQRPDIQVIPNMVDTDFFQLAPFRRKFSRFRFLFIGSLVEKKGVDTLLCAFAESFRLDSTVELMLVGVGAEAVKLQRMAIDLGIGSQVHFMGNISREELRSQMWRASCLVAPSRFETFGIAVAESLSTGLPVIATACGGPEDFVTRDSGVIIPSNDLAALSHALVQMRTDAKEYDSQNIREQIAGFCSRKVVAGRISNLYENVIDRSQEVS